MQNTKITFKNPNIKSQVNAKLIETKDVVTGCLLKVW